MRSEGDENNRTEESADARWEVLGELVGGEEGRGSLNNARWNFCPGRERVTCLCV